MSMEENLQQLVNKDRREAQYCLRKLLALRNTCAACARALAATGPAAKLYLDSKADIDSSGALVDIKLLSVHTLMQLGAGCTSLGMISTMY